MADQRLLELIKQRDTRPLRSSRDRCGRTGFRAGRPVTTASGGNHQAHGEESPAHRPDIPHLVPFPLGSSARFTYVIPHGPLVVTWMMVSPSAQPKWRMPGCIAE